LTASGLKLLGYPSDLGDVLSGNQFNIGALDIDGNIVRVAVGCVAANCNISIPANQICTESISFIATDVLGPNGQSVLNNANNAIAAVSGTANALQSLGVPVL